MRAHRGALPLAAMDGALGGLERDIPAVAGGPDDGAADLAADRGRDHPCGHRRCGAGGRTAGRSRAIEGILRGPGLGRAEFRRDRLAQDHRTCGAECGDGGIVTAGKIVPVGDAALPRRHVLGLEQVLDADRHAVDQRKRCTRPPARRGGVGRGTRARLVHLDPGEHARLTLGDGGEASLQIGAGRVGAGAEGRGRVMPGERMVVARIIAHGKAPSLLIKTSLSVNAPAAHPWRWCVHPCADHAPGRADAPRC